MNVDPPRTVGLCALCQHQQVVTSARGSTFILCGLAKTDPRFPKYPRLPVLKCSGYEKPASNQATEPQ